jgi:hypothetical protein
VGGGSNEDDLTTQLVEILQINHSVRMLLGGGGQQPSIMEQWGFEQAQVKEDRMRHAYDRSIDCPYHQHPQPPPSKK